MELDSIDINQKNIRDIYLRCVFIKILKVDTVNELYSGEIFLQAKWREPLLDNKAGDKNLDFSLFWNPKLSITNIFSETKSIVSHEIVFTESSNRAYLIEKRRTRATFYETLELQHFPFDCQDLSITVATDHSIDDLKMNECPHDLSKLNVIDGMESQEWNLFKHVEVESKIITNDCNIGPKKRQVMTFTCRATRQFSYFLINYFMISSMLFLLTFTSFSLTTSNTYGRLALCMTILLTSVTFKVAVSQNLPKIPYLTYLDKLILGNIIMIMSVCIWHALTSVWFLDQSVNATVATTNLKSAEIIVAISIVSFYIVAIFVFGLIIYFDAGSRRRKMSNKDKEFEIRVKKINDEQLTCEIC